MTRRSFYETVLRRAEAIGAVTPQMSVLVIAGGRYDRDILLACGYSQATISNVDSPTDDPLIYAPFDWSWQDAERLTFPDNSFDTVCVHAGLHHCHSPHRALAEMLRVARKSVVVIEARDSLAVRVAVKLGFTDQYEVEGVVRQNYQSGGVRNSAVPNYIYRWTEREIEKMLRSIDPTGEPRVEYVYGLRLPLLRLTVHRNPWIRWLVKGLQLPAKLVQLMAPKQGNEFGIIVRKERVPGDVFPWFERDSPPSINRAWCEKRYAADQYGKM